MLLQRSKSCNLFLRDFIPQNFILVRRFNLCFGFLLMEDCNICYLKHCEKKVFGFSWIFSMNWESQLHAFLVYFVFKVEEKVIFLRLFDTEKLYFGTRFFLLLLLLSILLIRKDSLIKERCMFWIVVTEGMYVMFSQRLDQKFQKELEILYGEIKR